MLESAGPEGQAVLHDIDVFISGINDYLADSGSSNAPWTRTDVFALNALKGQFVGQGGGDEARRSQFLGGLVERLGKKKALSVFDDLRQFKNRELPTSVDGRFPYGSIPKNAKGSVILDPGSFTSTPAVANRTLAREVAPGPPTHASNTLMINAEHSKTGNPLMVGGPQIGYFYPGLTYEIDMHAGDLQWRGATSAPFPGYMLIGRGEDFAHTLTSASGDIIDQYVEKLCDGSDTKYVYKGECREMGTFDAGTLDGDPVTFKTTVHGPVVGYATVGGEKVAISSKRSSYGKDTLDLLYNRRLSNGQVHSAKSFMKAASLTPQTFNSFYIDKKNIADVHGRPAAGAQQERRPRPADPRHRQVRVDRLPFEERPPAGHRPRGRHDHQLEPDHGQGLRCRRRRVGPQRLGRTGRPTRQEPRPARHQEGQVDARLGHRGDERGGDPGRTRDRHRSAAQAAAQGRQGPERAGAADARPDGRLEAAWRQPPGPRPRRQDRRPGRRDHGRLLEPDRRTR